MSKRTCTYVVNIIFTYESTAALVVSPNLNDMKLLAIKNTHVIVCRAKKCSHASK